MRPALLFEEGKHTRGHQARIWEMHPSKELDGAEFRVSRPHGRGRQAVLRLHASPLRQ